MAIRSLLLSIIADLLFVAIADDDYFSSFFITTEKLRPVDHPSFLIIANDLLCL